MLTKILLRKEKYKKQGLLEKIKKKREFKKEIQPMFNDFMKDAFIFKYDSLMELFIIKESYPYISTRLSILDDTYDYITLSYNIDKIISIRIDIHVEGHEILITVNEVSVKYTTKCKFTDKLRFNDYNSLSKDKEESLFNLCNELLKNEYIKLLTHIYFN